MKIIKFTLVILTAVFMSYHTQIFISHIEPSPVFSWLAACLVEGFIITLALSKRTPIRYLLLTLLFCISVVSASASFLVKNENLLDTFFNQKRVIQQLQEDLNRTREAYSYGEKYTTKTLARERALSDELREILKGQKGDIVLVNALIFFCFVIVIQATSVYVATTLKQRPEAHIKTPVETTETPVVEQAKRQTETESKTLQKTSEIEQAMRLREQGKSYREIARELGIPVSRVYRILR
jgi:DNA-binding NarL/FixJ family response regulator